MALPTIDLPLFETSLPSNGAKIKYRPFTVKEEKILLLAQESKDIEQAILSIKQVVNNCIQDTDVEQLAMLDLEYLMITLRSKSVDNNVEFFVKDPETDEKIKLHFDIDNVKIIRNDTHSDMIKLNDTYILKMRYPTITEFTALIKNGIDDPENNYQIMLKCMDKLLSTDEVFNFKDFSDKEIDDFVSGLNSDIVIKIKNFFDTMPKIRHEIKYSNKNGSEKTFVVEGIDTFFI